MAGIAAVIITRNEASRIRKALGSVRSWVDEIIVVDDMSTDETCEIAMQEFGARVFRRPADKDLAGQRNFGSDQAVSEWILQMDADEVFPGVTAEKIREAMAADRGAAAFELWRLNHFVGQPIRYAGAYSRIVRLYQRDKARYRVPDVHEQLKVNGKTGRIEADIHHYPFETTLLVFEKALRYGEYEAAQYVAENKTVSIREIKYRLVWRSVKIFWKNYVKKRGYKDGIHGLVWCVGNVITPQIKWIKIWEKAAQQGKLVP